MPLPTLETCDIPTDACCTRLYDVANDLLTVAHDALVDCLGDTCGPIPKYVSTGEPSYTDDGDYIAAWLSGFSVVPGGRNALIQRPQATYSFKLVESGWPTLESSNVAITVPDADRMHVLSVHSYSHIEKILRAQTSTTAVSGTVCHGVRMNNLTTLRRSSGLIGWQWSLTADVEW